jgi:hypothetical protein
MRLLARVPATRQMIRRVVDTIRCVLPERRFLPINPVRALRFCRVIAYFRGLVGGIVC